MSEPHIYVIHLKHRTDRKKQFTKAWSDAEMPTKNLHWHSAVLGSALSDEQLANFRTVARSRKARAGRVGCYCSHLAAIQKAIKKNHFPLLILEDDAVPTNQVDLASLFESAPSDARLLYFGALPIKDRKQVKNFCQGLNGWSRSDNVQLYGGHAYGFYSRESAQEVIDFLKVNKITFDSSLIRYAKANRDRVSIYCPFQFVQSEGYSDIEGIVRPVR